MPRIKRPHIALTAEKTGSLRSVDEVREATREGTGRDLWQGILSRAEADLNRPPITPWSEFPERELIHARHGNADWTACFAAGQRVLRGALVHLVTGDVRFRDLSLRQIASLFDPEDWPMWCDQAHLHQGSPPVDLRTGMLCHDLALAYDWLHPSLTDSERRFIIEGIDRRGIQPYLARLPGNPFWLNETHNWTTCIVGGLGIAGMALGDDHPDSQRLVAIAEPIMAKCLEAYGPEGEFNESVGYAGAIQLLVNYYLARRYQTGDRDNRLGQAPFPQACHWVMRFTNPPGHYLPFGDAHLRMPVAAQSFAAVAAATRDRVLQWFFATHYQAEQVLRHDCRGFLLFDDTLEPEPPGPEFPLGRAYHAYGQCISSRTDWNPHTTACVVAGKAGREHNHAHNDVGQVVIDGHGEPLIVDLGSCLYPSAELWDERHRFYNFSGFGHNIPMIGDRELRMTPDAQGRILDASFNRKTGASWTIDSTAAYEDVRSVTRTVVHLFPGIVAVLDLVELKRPEKVVLRWHTVDRCSPDPDGAFLVKGEIARLAGRVINLNRREIRIRRGEHAYKAPYDRNRLGELQVQKNESFIETESTDQTVRLLSLFAIFGPDATPSAWMPEGRDSASIPTGDGVVRAGWASGQLRVANLDTGCVVQFPDPG
ncbi:MAG: heparinase II/III family protein [Opitutaceae bacterium]